MSTAHNRPGYIFLLVLIVLAVGLIMVLAATERAGVQAALAQDRIRDYQRHHEMLGVRDLVTDWAQRPGNRERLAQSVESGTPFYDAVLPGGITVSASAQDAQGTVLLPELGTLDAQLTFALNDIVARLPPARPDLVRSSGPATISLKGAPIEVLRALAEGNDELVQLLRAMQAEPTMDPARFASALSTTGFTDKSATLSRVMTFAPTLYRLRVRVFENDQLRRYSMLADFTGNMLPVVRSLRFEPGDAGDELLDPARSTDRPARTDSGK